MKKLLLLLVPVLALLILVAPVAADEEHGNSQNQQAISEDGPANSAEAHARNEDRKAEAEEDTSESEGTSEDENESGAFRLQFYTVTGASSDNVTDEEVDGTVKVVAPSGDVGLIIQGNIQSGLVADGDEDAVQEFEVWVRNLTGYTGPFEKQYAPLGYFMLDTFTTNGQGHGSFHINIPAEYLSADSYDIQVAINMKDGGTVIATPWPGLTVDVGSED